MSSPLNICIFREESSMDMSDLINSVYWTLDSDDSDDSDGACGGGLY